MAILIAAAEATRARGGDLADTVAGTSSRNPSLLTKEMPLTQRALNRWPLAPPQELMSKFNVLKGLPSDGELVDMVFDSQSWL